MESTSVALAVTDLLIGIRAVYELIKRATSMTWFIVNLVLVGFFLVSSASAGDSSQQTMKLSWQDTWHYDGEVRPDTGKRGACHNANCPYCTNGFCAHGIGDLSHDGSWDYVGSFVDGVMHGIGHYRNDFYEYVGGFEYGKFHGEGKVLCNRKWLKGQFTHGRYQGKIVGWSGQGMFCR